MSAELKLKRARPPIARVSRIYSRKTLNVHSFPSRHVLLSAIPNPVKPYRPKNNVITENIESVNGEISNKTPLFEMILKNLGNSISFPECFVLKARVKLIIVKNADANFAINELEEIAIFSGDKILISKPQLEFVFEDCRSSKFNEIETPKNWYNKYISEKKENALGEGASGQVFKAFTIVNPHSAFALKIIKTTTNDENFGHSVKSSMQEIEALKVLKHPNIIELHDKIETINETILVLDFMTQDMVGYIQNTDIGRLTEQQSKSAIRQILNAIDYLHKKSIAHNDMKLDNILVSETRTRQPLFKICDFGSATFKTEYNSEKEKDAKIDFTLNYVAPEVLRACSGIISVYSRTKADMWSFGVICYVTVTGVFPFNEEEDDENRFLGKFRYDKTIKISEELRKFIKKLLTVDSTKRMNASQALSHSWIRQAKKIDFTSEVNQSIEELQSPIVLAATTKRLLAKTVARRSLRLATKRRSCMDSVSLKAPKTRQFEWFSQR